MLRMHFNAETKLY